MSAAPPAATNETQRVTPRIGNRTTKTIPASSRAGSVARALSIACLLLLGVHLRLPMAAARARRPGSPDDPRRVPRSDSLPLGARRRVRGVGGVVLFARLGALCRRLG